MRTMCKSCFNEGRKAQAEDMLLVKTKADLSNPPIDGDCCDVCTYGADYTVLEFIDEVWQ